jgi:hypothetical protein
MADIMEQQKPDDVPADTSGNVSPGNVSSDAPASPPGEQTLDDILSEFDAGTQTPPPDPAHNDAALDEILASFGDTQKQADVYAQHQEVVNSLRGEVAALREAEFQKAEMAAFDKFTSDLQTRCGQNVPEDFARTQLLAAMVERPQLRAVWSYRSLTNEQLQQADREFRSLERQYNETLREPDSPQKQQLLGQIYRRGERLGLMMNAKTIANQVIRDVIERSNKVQGPIDAEATQSRMEVAAAVRGASSKVPAELPPNFGTMTDNELRNYTKINYGF